jgi:hypothetical protein
MMSTSAVSRIALAIFLIWPPAAAWSAGRDERVINDHPDRTWGSNVGGFFTSGKSYAVVIGISEYAGERNGGYPQLRTARDDADKMVRFLKDDAGFDVIYVLTEDKVTKQRLDRLMLDEVRTAVGAYDRFLFYWSGHGDQLLVGGQRHGFLPLAASKRSEFSGMVSMDDISRWNSYLLAQQALFVLDSCLSGLAGSELKAPHDSRLEQLAKPAHQLLTAGEAGESVISGERWSGSLFTDSFIKGAKGEASAPDGVVSLWSLFDYIQRRVLIEREAVRWQRSLTPQLRVLSAGSGAFFFKPKAVPGTVDLVTARAVSRTLVERPPPKAETLEQGSEQKGSGNASVAVNPPKADERGTSQGDRRGGNDETNKKVRVGANMRIAAMKYRNGVEFYRIHSPYVEDSNGEKAYFAPCLTNKVRASYGKYCGNLAMNSICKELGYSGVSTLLEGFDTEDAACRPRYFAGDKEIKFGCYIPPPEPAPARDLPIPPPRPPGEKLLPGLLGTVLKHVDCAPNK